MTDAPEIELLQDALLDWWAARAQLAVGRDICSEQLPEPSSALPDTMAVIKSTGGPGRPWGPHEVATFQLLARGKDIDATRQLAQKLYNVLYPPPRRVPLRNVLLSENWLALSIDAVQIPYPLGPDDANLFQWVFNLQIKAGNLAQ